MIDKMTRFFIQLRYALQSRANIAKRMNRCVDVENVLYDIANGKRPLPNKDECRQLAFKLSGVRAKDIK